MRFIAALAVGLLLAFSASAQVTPNPPYTGQLTISTTGTAVCLPPGTLTNGVIIKSLSTNNATGATVGPYTVTNTVSGTGNGYIIFPGEAAPFASNFPPGICINGTAGDIFTYVGN